MNKFALLMLFISLPILAQEPGDMPPLNMAEPPKLLGRNFRPNENHWLWSFALEGTKYEVPYEFDGELRHFHPNKQEMWGGRLGFGREFFLGNNFVAVTKIEGYYLGTPYPKVIGGDTNYYKKTSNLWGGDITQSLGHQFHFVTKNPVMDEWASLTLEPFIEAGIGRGTAYNRLNYQANTGTVQEYYRQRVRDNLQTARLGIGANMTGGNGYFFTFKIFVTYLDVIERSTDTYKQPNGGTASSVNEKDKSVSLDPITTISIGGGYKF